MVYFLQCSITTALTESLTIDVFDSIIGFWMSYATIIKKIELKHMSDPSLEPSSPDDPADVGAWQNVLTLAITYTTSVILATAGFLFGQQHFRDQQKLRATIENYDIRTAQCSDVRDRDVLLGFINDIFYESARRNSLRTSAVPTPADARSEAGESPDGGSVAGEADADVGELKA